MCDACVSPVTHIPLMYKLVPAWQADTEDLQLACIALARLVRLDNPEDRTLSEIAHLWGEGIPDEHRAALRRIEPQLAEALLRLFD